MLKTETAKRRMHTGEKAMPAYALVRRYGWVQGAWGNREDGFCLSQAVREAYPDGGDDYRARKKICACLTGPVLPLILWNDAPGRTKKQVLALLKKAGV